MYAQDFLEKYNVNDAVGSCEQKVSQRMERQQGQWQIRFGVLRSKQIQSVGVARSTECSGTFVVALECGFMS